MLLLLLVHQLFFILKFDLGCEHASHRSGLLLAAHLGVHGQLGRELTIEAGLRLVRLT